MNWSFYTKSLIHQVNIISVEHLNWTKCDYNEFSRYSFLDAHYKYLLVYTCCPVCILNLLYKTHLYKKKHLMLTWVVHRACSFTVSKHVMCWSVLYLAICLCVGKVVEICGSCTFKNVSFIIVSISCMLRTYQIIISIAQKHAVSTFRFQEWLIIIIRDPHLFSYFIGYTT